MIFEDDVVTAVAAQLRADGWTIESTALATQHGDDIVAVRGDERLVVEAKGQGSSKPHTRRYGQPFNRGQAATHVGVAVLRCLRVVSEGSSTAAIALPDDEIYAREIERVTPALAQLNIRVFVVDQHGAVRQASQ
ncbi:hypothetical protein AA0Z99_05725 [Agrococcus sp. 1P02AA]|uniref:hypothetical protein n=1 Tax=Agrococcus sp. 1P02AA TaxID=3132259 RepID=UPI0039A52829